MKHRLLLPVTAIFTATLLISNTLDTKIFTILGLDLPAGIILFPLAYLAGDILTEVYGFATARRIIWGGFASLLLMVVSYEIALLLPPASFWGGQVAFEATMSQVPRIVCASIAAYLCGEFTNSYIVAKMKVFTEGRGMGLRFATSTVFGQLVDTAVFVLIAFAGKFSVGSLLTITVSAWLVKVAWELIALPITIPFVRWMKVVEGEDFFDRGTNFNPFHL